MTTGDRIREARLNKKMTQTELAEKVGVKTAAINKYQTGLVVNLKRETISALAKALEVSPTYLMGWDDTEEPSVDERIQQMHANPRLGLVFDRSAKMSDKDLDTIINLMDAILRERDGD